MGYALPTPTSYVSADYHNHRYERNPPSSEPGTDYGCGYGSAVYAPANGVVVDIQTSPSGGTGRYVAIDFDDGRRGRALHLSATGVSVGQRVSRGQRVATSGASGYGDDWYYGPHAHQTLWNFHGYSFCASCTIDFELYVGSGPTPTPEPPDDDEEDDMSQRGMKGAAYKRSSDGVTVYILFNEESGFWVEHSGVAGSYNNAIAQCWLTGSWPTITQGHRNVLVAKLDQVKPSAGASTLSASVDELAVAITKADAAEAQALDESDEAVHV